MFARNTFLSTFERLESRSLMSTTLFDQTNLVSDKFGVAQIQDKHLINPWGIDMDNGGPTSGANDGVIVLTGAEFRSAFDEITLA